MLYTTFVLTSLLGPLPLCAVAGVYFDPDMYMVNESGNVTLILKTNVTLNYRFSVLVNTRDGSANSEYCINTVHCEMQYILTGQIIIHFNYLLLTYVHAIHLFHSNVAILTAPM